MARLALDFVVDEFAQPVHPLGRHRCKKAELARRMASSDLFEADLRQTFEHSSFRQILLVYAKGRYFVFAIVLLAVERRQLGKILYSKEMIILAIQNRD